MSDVYTSDNVVSSIMTGDNSRAKEGILSILGQKSMDELEVRKAEVAQNMFNTHDPENPEIPVVDPYSGQPTEVLEKPHSISA